MPVTPECPTLEAGTGNKAPAVLAFTQEATPRATSISPALDSTGCRRVSDADALAFHHTQDPISGPSAPCLGAEGMGVLAFNAKQDGSDADLLSPTLLGMPHDRTHPNGGGQVAVCVTVPVTHSLVTKHAGEDGTGRGTPIIASTLCAGGRETPPHGTMDGQNIVCAVSGFAGYREMPPTLVASGGDNGAGSEALVVAGTLGVEHARKPGQEEAANGLVPFSFGIPRRLTPKECERLMGWPDSWTEVINPRTRKPMSDAARYKMIGNGVASPVVQWIAGRLLQYLNQ